jgi:hypothetical protein
VPTLALAAPIVAAQFVGLLIAGAVWGAHPARRCLSWMLVLSGLALPWLLPDLPPIRAFSALLAMFGPMRLIELTVRPGPPPFLRVLTFVLPIDANGARPARPRFDGPLLVHALAHGLLGAAGCWLAANAPQLALRWVGATVALYGIADALSNVLRVVLAAAGLATLPLQIHPALAESAGDFWGRRWNRAVAAWLRTSFFVPVARRWGTRTGAILAFFASAVVHFFPVLVALSIGPALLCGGYFLVEALFVLIEGRLRVLRWPRPARHAWAMFAVLGPSPLFIVPVLEIFGRW